MWNLIFIIIAFVASMVIVVMSFKVQTAMKDLHKDVHAINPDFLKTQKDRIMYIMLTGLSLCGMVIMINLPTIFEVDYSIWDGFSIAISSIIYALFLPWIVKMIRS